MKKLFLSLIAVAVGTLGSFAQDDLVATLGTGSSLLTFTGADALSEAYTAASDGDVITLSPGVFNAVTIEKGITIRGAGMVGLESNGYVSTQLSGDFTISDVPSGTTTVPAIEGVQCLGSVGFSGNNLAPVKISRCRFEKEVWGWGVSMTAHSCIFAYSFRSVNNDGNNSYKNTTINCYNCVIVHATSGGYDSYHNCCAKIVATNCLVNSYDANVPYSVFLNCIIYNSPFRSYYLPSSCSAQNCLGINSVYDLFESISNPSNVMSETFTSIFKTLTDISQNPAITETYELTETAAATYLGDDGTQVGIYGGSYPFNPTPSNPQVKTFNVTNATEGDQLRVKINVE